MDVQKRYFFSNASSDRVAAGRFGLSLSIQISRCMGWLAELQLPPGLTALIVNRYIHWFGIDMAEVHVPERGFATLGDFFARSLKPGVRPICRDPEGIVSPCDGIILDKGPIGEGSATRLLVKGSRYGLVELTGTPQAAAELSGGGYCAIYLHPKDYHRVHAPMNSIVLDVRHLPGTRMPVAPWAAAFTDRVLSRNERLIFTLKWSEVGDRLLLVMVAALGVGGIERLAQNRSTPQDGLTPETMRQSGVLRGSEIGAFRFGSTVLMFWPKQAICLADSLRVGQRVSVGQRIGQLRTRELSLPV